MVFDMAPKDVAGDLRGYLQNGWVTRQQLQNLQSIDLGGQPGAVGFGQVSIGGQPAQAMFSAVRGQDGRVYRFLFADTNGLSRADLAAFEQTLRSFRPLSAAEAAALKPSRIKLVPVRAGDTIDSLARQMQVEREPARPVRAAERARSRPHAAARGQGQDRAARLTEPSPSRITCS